MTAPHPLDNPVRSSLAGPHARFAERRGNVLRYPVEVSPFLALPDQPDAADWADAAALAGPGALVALAGVRVPAPDDWEVTLIGEGVQLVDVEVEVAADREAMRLGPGDVPEMLELAARTKPGPFLRARGEMAFLHAVADNPAIGLYEALGFRLRRGTVFSAARVPADQPPD